MWKREIIKVPVRMLIIIIILIIIFFSMVILVGNRKMKNYVEATLSTEIPLTQITLHKGYGYLRGAVFYNENNYINTSARFIGGNAFDKNIWKSNGPIVDFDTIPYEYTLDDLEFPYYLYKRKNSDTINVIKDGSDLRFLITKR
jgi:hypothetical protein